MTLLVLAAIAALLSFGCEEMADDAPTAPVAYDSTEVHHHHWDTLVVVEVNYDSTFVIRIDSLFFHYYHYDSIWVYINDSLFFFDSTWVFNFDSTFNYDSMFVFNYDTVWVMQGSWWSDQVPIMLDWQHYHDGGTVTNPAGNFIVGVEVKFLEPLPQGKEFLMEFGTHEERFNRDGNEIDTIWFHPGAIPEDVPIRLHIVDIGAAKPAESSGTLCHYYLEGVRIWGIQWLFD
ncbi:MAG: hypothetical protein WC505_07490 [Patescibacteria group bacterium]